MGVFGWSLGLGLMAAVLIGGLIAFLVSRYRIAEPNQVLVIANAGAEGRVAKTIIGGGGFVWPVVQTYGYMSLAPMTVKIDLKDALSSENIRVMVPTVFTIAVGAEAEVLQNAAQRLFRKPKDEIEKMAADVLFGQMRQVISSMTINEINQDRDTFRQRVQHAVEPELKKLGLVLLNVNIQDLDDQSGYIKAIGQKAAAKAVNEAKADVAEQERLGAERVAVAEQQQAVAVAEAQKEREIGKATAQREQAVRMADLTREREVAEETAKLEKEAAVREAERARRIRVAQAEAEAVAGETAAKIQVTHAEQALKVQQAEAFRAAETATATAQAAVEEARNKAQAQAAIAQAARVEAEQIAALVAPAKAQAAELIARADGQAEQVRKAAQAEADAIRVKYEAEAAGQQAVALAKAEGLRKLVEAAGGNAGEAYRLLMIDHIEAVAETAAKSIANVKFDKVFVWDGPNGAATSGFLQSLARSVPPVMEMIGQFVNFGDDPKVANVTKVVATDGATTREAVVEALRAGDVAV